MILIVFLFFATYSLVAQDQVTIDLNDRSISISTTASAQELENASDNLWNGKDYIFIEFDTSYRCYYHDIWGGGVDRPDTFFYIRTDVIRKKNKIDVSPSLNSTSYQLHRQLKGKSWQERDSILNATMQEVFEWNPLRGYKKISYEVTPIQYYQGKYPYIDIYRTYKTIKKKGERSLYDSRAVRIFIIGEIFYYIDVRDNSRKYGTYSALRSRRAVCCDFKHLVNNLKIIEAEDTSSSK